MQANLLTIPPAELRPQKKILIHLHCFFFQRGLRSALNELFLKIIPTGKNKKMNFGLGIVEERIFLKIIC